MDQLPVIKKDSQLFLAISLTGELTFTIALPVVFFTLVGNYLDDKFGYVFLFVLLGGIIGIFFGILGVYKKAKKMHERIYKKTQNLNAKSQN